MKLCIKKDMCVYVFKKLTVLVCTLVWNDDVCTVLNRTCEKPVLLGSHEEKLNLAQVVI